MTEGRRSVVVDPDLLFLTFKWILCKCLKCTFSKARNRMTEIYVSRAFWGSLLRGGGVGETLPRLLRRLNQCSVFVDGHFKYNYLWGVGGRVSHL